MGQPNLNTGDIKLASGRQMPERHPIAVATHGMHRGNLCELRQHRWDRNISSVQDRRYSSRLENCKHLGMKGAAAIRNVGVGKHSYPGHPG
jgi:hypothetical protein